jgi:hypothetical protein
MVSRGEGWNRFLGKSTKPNPVLAGGIAHFLTNQEAHLNRKSSFYKAYFKESKK